MRAARTADAAKPVRLAWSINELAYALGTNYWTVNRLVTGRDGEPPQLASFTINGEYRITLFEVARLLEVPVADLEALIADVQARVFRGADEKLRAAGNGGAA